jgi:hypothetical protein
MQRLIWTYLVQSPIGVTSFHKDPSFPDELEGNIAQLCVRVSFIGGHSPDLKSDWDGGGSRRPDVAVRVEHELVDDRVREGRLDVHPRLLGFHRQEHEALLDVIAVGERVVGQEELSAWESINAWLLFAVLDEEDLYSPGVTSTASNVTVSKRIREW